MAFSFRTIPRRHSRALSALGLTIVLAAAFAFVGLRQPERASPDSWVMESIGRRLLDNSTVGRQALVSSPWWPPLPTLLRLPLVAALGGDAWPVASVIVSALFGAASVALLGRMLLEWGVGWPRYALMLALAASPAYRHECTNGSSATTVVFFSLMVMGGLVEWMEARKLRSLIYFACGAALLALSSFEMGVWLWLAYLLLAADQWLARADGARKEAVLILGLLPGLYAMALWILMNWLILGDGLYFLRPLFAGVLRAQVPQAASAGLAGLVPWAAALSLAVLAGSAMRHARAGVYAGILALGVAPLALGLRAAGALWGSIPVPFILFPLSLICAGCAVRLLQPFSKTAAALAAVVPLCLALAVGDGQAVAPAGGMPAADARAGVDALRYDNDVLRHRIRAHVLARSPYAKVFVCGYDSFLLLGHDGGDVFVHALDFNFNKAKEDYVGHTLFVLVHRPEGRCAADSIHRQYRDVFALGQRGTLYDGDWGEWRLFEIVQAPR